MKIIISILLVVFLAGCIATTHKMQTPFNVNEHAKYAKSGNATIKGQAFLKRNDGQVVTCAGSKVMLVPDTAYTREAVHAAARGHQPDPADSEKAKEMLQKKGIKQKITRESICDAQGNFTFNNLPSGNWILATEVIWYVNVTQGGSLVKYLSTASGKTTEAILTDADMLR